MAEHEDDELPELSLDGLDGCDGEVPSFHEMFNSTGGEDDSEAADDSERRMSGDDADYDEEESDETEEELDKDDYDDEDYTWFEKERDTRFIDHNHEGDGCHLKMFGAPARAHLPPDHVQVYTVESGSESGSDVEDLDQLVNSEKQKTKPTMKVRFEPGLWRSPLKGGAGDGKRTPLSAPGSGMDTRRLRHLGTSTSRRNSVTGRSDGRRSGTSRRHSVTGRSDGRRSGTSRRHSVTGRSDGRRSGMDTSRLLHTQSSSKSKTRRKLSFGSSDDEGVNDTRSRTPKKPRSETTPHAGNLTPFSFPGMGEGEGGEGTGGGHDDRTSGSSGGGGGGDGGGGDGDGGDDSGGGGGDDEGSDSDGGGHEDSSSDSSGDGSGGGGGGGRKRRGQAYSGFFPPNYTAVPSRNPQTHGRQFGRQRRELERLMGGIRADFGDVGGFGAMAIQHQRHLDNQYDFIVADGRAEDGSDVMDDRYRNLRRGHGFTLFPGIVNEFVGHWDEMIISLERIVPWVDRQRASRHGSLDKINKSSKWKTQSVKILACFAVQAAKGPNNRELREGGRNSGKMMERVNIHHHNFGRRRNREIAESQRFVDYILEHHHPPSTVVETRIRADSVMKQDVCKVYERMNEIKNVWSPDGLGDPTSVQGMNPDMVLPLFLMWDHLFDMYERVALTKNLFLSNAELHQIVRNPAIGNSDRGVKRSYGQLIKERAHRGSRR